VLQEQKDAEDALRGKWLEFERDLGKIESWLKAQSYHMTRIRWSFEIV
jgi:hypothetical protein